MSGQMINYSKSSVTFSTNTRDSMKAVVCEQLGVNTLQHPSRYLGMPMFIGRRKVATFSFLADKVEKKLKGWQNHTLSKAGKMTLLKTAAQVIPNFWMNMLLIPFEVCDKIEKTMNAFWWGSGEPRKGIKWLSWDKLCSVKEDGGLGFKNLRDFNITMLAKQAWRIINETNPLVTSILRAKYFPNSSFLEATLGANPSYAWRSLMETKEVIRKGCRRRIGNGKSTKIWKVPWLPNPKNGYLTTDMPAELKETTVENFFCENKREWDNDVLSDLFNERDTRLIKQIPIPVRDREDSWCWTWEDNDEFSVKSCYRQLQGERVCLDRVFWKQLWGLKLPGKVINFLWRICRGVLPTAMTLRTKYVDISPVCSWCQLHGESDVHVLFSCDFAKEVWRRAGLGDVIQLLDGDTAMSVLKRVFQYNGIERRGIVGLVCWNLWQRRNSWVWNRINISSFGIQSRATSMLAEWNRAREEKGKHLPQGQVSSRLWCKPPDGWVKISIDAMCQPGSGKSGVGCWSGCSRSFFEG